MIHARHDLAVYESYGVPLSVAQAYAESLEDHIRFVQEAGQRLGVARGLLLSHDLSKWGPEEFPGYALHFHGGGAPDLFAGAWLHHLHHNAHHPEHWRFTDGYTPRGSTVEDGCVEMPAKYALEMLADWQGASMAYTGSWDIADWLHKNISRIRVHSRTAGFLRETLDALGYGDIVNVQPFGGG